MLTITPTTLMTHNPPRIRRIALLMSALDFRYFTKKKVPIRDTTNTKPKNIPAMSIEIWFIDNYWIRVARVVYITRNPEVPLTTSGINPRERRM